MRILLLTLLVTTATLSAQDLKAIHKDGGSFAKENKSRVKNQLTNFDPNDCLPEEDKGKEFDSKVAREALNSTQITHTKEIANPTSNRYFDENEYFFTRSDNLTKDNGAPVLDEIITEYYKETCMEADAPFSLSLERSLEVKVTHCPEEKIISKTCKGHKDSKKHYWKSDAENEKKKQEKRLSADPSIKSYKVKIKGGGIASDYTVRWTWEHYEDSPTCNNFSKQTKMVTPETWKEEDQWTYLSPEDFALTTSQQCTFTGRECLSGESSKSIQGRNVQRQCWLEKIHYACRFEPKNKCDFLRHKNCLLDYKECIYTSNRGCSLWEMVFKCASKMGGSEVESIKGTVGTNAEDWETSYEQNTSFSAVATTLTIFEEMKRELEGLQATDATTVQLFRGKKAQCAKSVAENAMYDCCFSYTGLANEMKLSHCTADEVALEDMRARGLCHYIGSYEEKFLDMWKSRTEHVYCCFPSILSRVFQEQARKQLKLDWGSPRDPDCRGLTQEEIRKLDFSKLDLGEAFEKLPNVQKIDQSQTEFLQQDRIKLMEEKLKEKISNMNSGTHV